MVLYCLVRLDAFSNGLFHRQKNHLLVNLSGIANQSLGEFVDIATSQGPISLVSCLISLVAIGIYAITVDGQENDDDDSGDGGLMQPVC